MTSRYHLLNWQTDTTSPNWEPLFLLLPMGNDQVIRGRTGCRKTPSLALDPVQLRIPNPPNLCTWVSFLFDSCEPFWEPVSTERENRKRRKKIKLHSIPCFTLSLNSDLTRRIVRNTYISMQPSYMCTLMSRCNYSNRIATVYRVPSRFSLCRVLQS